ncbi:hypothetical protein EC9_03670 [Rosistilla ulvae]|uniref:Uncharacterized protein n=1 Tax=Rosistilla ulvae TaxID=1930277 RepID=A0A517LUA7_9BACT|nr:hypothetical protein EC9_03670 [Rosistilla ulvae]
MHSQATSCLRLVVPPAEAVSATVLIDRMLHRRTWRSEIKRPPQRTAGRQQRAPAIAGSLRRKACQGFASSSAPIITESWSPEQQIGSSRLAAADWQNDGGRMIKGRMIKGRMITPQRWWISARRSRFVIDHQPYHAAPIILPIIPQTKDQSKDSHGGAKARSFFREGQLGSFPFRAGMPCCCKRYWEPRFPLRRRCSDRIAAGSSCRHIRRSRRTIARGHGTRAVRTAPSRQP